MTVEPRVHHAAKIEVTDDELARVPDSVRTFAVVLDCSSIIYTGAPPTAVGAKLEPSRRYGATITQRVHQAMRR